MTDIFPSILPPDEQAATLEIMDEWDYQVLRKVISECDTEQVSGRSTQIQMADWITGQYDTDDLETLRQAGQKDAESDTEVNEHIQAAIDEL
jgi:hypothetical protein